MSTPTDQRVDHWLDALSARHGAVLTFAEIRRGLQALSSLYVERRGRLGAGAALDGAGKRAAFASYYGPLHYLICRHVLEELGAADRPPEEILDLGCGTGVAGAAWALLCHPAPRVNGVERNGWATAEARWTLARLGLRGQVQRGDGAAIRLPGPRGAVIAAFFLNELADATRESLRLRLLAAACAGTRVLLLEPLSRRVTPWWDAWAGAVGQAGGRADEWRLPDGLLPATVTQLGRAAGLDPRGLGVRSLALGFRSAPDHIC